MRAKSGIDRHLKKEMKLLVIICSIQFAHLQSIAGEEHSNGTGEPFFLEFLFRIFQLMPRDETMFGKNISSSNTEYA